MLLTLVSSLPVQSPTRSSRLYPVRHGTVVVHGEVLVIRKLVVAGIVNAEKAYIECLTTMREVQWNVVCVFCFKGVVFLIISSLEARPSSPRFYLTVKKSGSKTSSCAKKTFHG